MSKVVKYAVIAAIGYVIYQHNGSDRHPLMGTWKSDKEASMDELLKVGVTQKQKELFNDTLGEAIIKIGEERIRFTIDGKVKSNEYLILSENNDCYNIQTESDTYEYCIKGNFLYVPSSFKGAKEVFKKV